MIVQEQRITHYTVTLGEITREGNALAEITERVEDGTERVRTVAVPAGLPGEQVTIAFEAPPHPRPGRRRRHWKARPPRVWITEIHQPSPSRIAAPCPVFGTCGGCQLQHMPYTEQLRWKRASVNQLLREIGGFDDLRLLETMRETVPCDDSWHYRNHMRFSVNRSGQPGLTARGTHRVLPLESCPIAQEPINRALKVLNRFSNQQPQVLIRCGTATGHVMIQPAPNQEAHASLIAEGLDIHSDTMEEQLAGETFRIRPSSFFQTNTAQAEKMVRMVLEGLLSGRHDITDETNGFSQGKSLRVIDAYCGVGTFALAIARHVRKVIAIEESASAIKDAQWNLRETSNVEILKGKVEDILPTLTEQIDGLVIDPPRAGCQQSVLDALIQHPVSRIVYVSCDPSTLARDLNILCHRYPTYTLHSVQPLDMFPHTAHIECVAVLERL